MNRVLDDSSRVGLSENTCRVESSRVRVESSRVGLSENTCRVESSRVRVESSRVEPSRLFFDSFRPLMLILCSFLAGEEYFLDLPFLPEKKKTPLS
jgi:hypothetical protein